MNIDQILAAVHEGPTMEIPGGWGQGRATFGGLVAAVMIEKLKALVSADRQLRSLSVSFVGPVAPGSIEMQANILRSGKAVTQGECRLTQNGEVQAVMLASFGGNRESSLSVPQEPAPVIKPAAESLLVPYIPNVIPDFVQHIQMAHADKGGIPYTGSKTANISGWVRMKEPSPVVGLGHICALVDAWPPAPIAMLSQPAPGSSLTWTLELVDGSTIADAGNAWWQYQAVTEYCANGYAHIRANLWDANGKLVVISRQTAVIFG